MRSLSVLSKLCLEVCLLVGVLIPLLDRVQAPLVGLHHLLQDDQLVLRVPYVDVGAPWAYCRQRCSIMVTETAL